MLARGLRNCNPGNIVRDGTDWLGLADNQSDPRFCVFISAQYGIRALAKILLTYQDVHNLRTIAGIINRWAPPQENDTEAYIAFVSCWTGINANQELTLYNRKTLTTLVNAIISFENGDYVYPAATVSSAIDMAYGVPREGSI